MTTTYPRLDGHQACRNPTTAAAAAYTAVPGADPEPAKELCRRCPFQEPCLAYALQQDVHGVWGGLTDKERSARRARDQLADPVPASDELDQLILTWRGAPRTPTAGKERT